LMHWLPGGTHSGREYQALNPTRSDGRPGSFSINTSTGQWADFATDDKGGDLISLVAYLDGCSQGEAESRLVDFLGLQPKKAVTTVTTVTGNHNGKKTRTLDAVGAVTSKDDTRVTTVTVPDGVTAPDFTHPKHGKPAVVWTYCTAEGRPWFYVCRFDTPKGKEILPRSWDGSAWRWKGAPAPRPLYNLHTLADKPTAPVLFTEGEKAADAAARLFPGAVASTTPNGAKAADKCDLSPLQGRRVLIWPDNDEAGTQYAEHVAELAHQAGAVSIAILKLDKLPGAPLPEKADAADVALTTDEAAALLADDTAWREVKSAEPEPERGQDEAPAMPKGFTLEADGVFYHGTDRDGKPLSPAWTCSPLRIVALTRDADGTAWGRLLEFHDLDGKPHRWAMPLERLAGDGNEHRRTLLNMGLQIAPSTQARQRLTEYLQTAPVKARARCVAKTGWHGGVFVLPDETLGENSERVLLQSLHEPAAIRTAGTLDGWRDSVAAPCSGNSRLTLAVSAAFATPLLDIGGDDSGGINLQGASSSGKTTALYAAVSVWGGPEYLQRWRATANGLEATALAHNDALLCLDELAQVDAREAGEVAYMLANGTGKQRAQRDGLAKPKANWRVLFLSAGEIGLAQHMREAGKKARAGQEVRLADIPADAGMGYGLFETLHGYPDGAALSDSIREAARTHYGHAAREYLAELVKIDRDKLRERLRELRADFAAEALPADADGQARRVCDRFALIAAGGELATVWNLTGWQRGAATQAARKCFVAWLDNRGGAGAQEERQALAQVAQFFELHGESRFSNLDDTDTDDDETQSTYKSRTINRAGFKRTTTGGTAEYFILPEVWRTEVSAGLDARYVARLCVERGLIVPGNDGRPTSIHRLADLGPTRCYHFIKTGVGM
jgi:putative DNA primase/helicase